jgi:hypothetical protein
MCGHVEKGRVHILKYGMFESVVLSSANKTREKVSNGGDRAIYTRLTVREPEVGPADKADGLKQMVGQVEDETRTRWPSPSCGTEGSW